MLPATHFLQDVPWMRILNNAEADFDFPQDSFGSNGPRYLPSSFNYPYIHSATAERETLSHHPGHENEEKEPQKL